MQIIGSIRYGYLVMREGSAKSESRHETLVVLGRRGLSGRIGSASLAAAAVSAAADFPAAAGALEVAALRAAGERCYAAARSALRS